LAGSPLRIATHAEIGRRRSSGGKQELIFAVDDDDPRACFVFRHIARLKVIDLRARRRMTTQ